MATVLFVHGTGVRRASFLSTFAAIQSAFDRNNIEHALEPCLWGDVLGAAAVLKAVPDVTLSASDPTTLTREQDYARWDLLYRDPLFELRLLKNQPSSGPKPPSVGATIGALWKRISGYTPSERVRACLTAAGLDDVWSAAWKAIVLEDPTASQATLQAREIGEPAQAVARAVVAQMLQMAFDQGLPILNSRQRDALVDHLVEDWQARVAGVGAFLLRFIGDMASTVATPIVKWRRGPLSEAASPAAGDTLRYQARGAPIRDYIRTSVGKIEGDVYLLGHSLGGIACVDLLAAESIAKVKGLITVGSQASYLHEIGALSSLEPGATELPAHFPRWLNLYDPYDFLSYVAAPVFVRGVRDCRIESGQPFPHSHSAYWNNPDTWTAIRSFLA
jgi:hypothetical protein